MKVKAKFANRDDVMKRLRAIVPAAEAELAKTQIEVTQELANRIRARAPRSPGGGDYAQSIQADRLVSRPSGQALISAPRGTKDPNATGVFADYIWRFLEFGTAPHNVAKGGGTVKGKISLRNGGGIGHPGTTAQPHIFPTYRAYRKTIRRKMASAVNRAVRARRKEITASLFERGTSTSFTL